MLAIRKSLSYATVVQNRDTAGAELRPALHAPAIAAASSLNFLKLPAIALKSRSKKEGTQLPPVEVKRKASVRAGRTA